MLKQEVTITDEVIQQVKEKLVASTKSENRSVSAIVKGMKAEIRMARKAGKTWKEIEKILSEAGINVSRPTLAAQCPANKKAKKLGHEIVKKKKESVTPTTPPKPLVVQPVSGNGNSAYFEIKPDSDDL